MKRILVLVVVLLLMISQSAFGQMVKVNAEPINSPGGTATATTDAVNKLSLTPDQLAGSGSSAGVQKPLQQVAQPRALTEAEKKQVEAYLKLYFPDLNSVNRKSIKAALEFDLGMGFVHIPLMLCPNWYWKSYQDYTQGKKMTKSYINLPGYTPGDIPDLNLMEVPSCGGGGCCTSCSPGAVQISHSGDREESAVAAGWMSWKDIPQQKAAPPPSNECPGVNPPAKPPTTGPIHDPTGPNPGGPPAPGGPPPPAGPSIGDGTVPDPTPTSPPVVN